MATHTSSKNWSAADRMAAVEQEGFDFAALDRIAVEMCNGETSAVAQLYAHARVALPTVVWDPGPDDLPLDGLRFLLDHWRGIAGASSVPLVSTLDPIDLRPVLGNVMLVDVVEGGRNFRYRLYGSAIARVSSGDKTGRLLTELDGLPSRFFFAVYRAVLHRPVPIYTHHVPPTMKNFRDWHRLILPLADENGAVVRFLVGCYAGPKFGSLPGVQNGS